MSINEDYQSTLSCSIRFIVNSVDEVKLFTSQFPQYVFDSGLYLLLRRPD